MEEGHGAGRDAALEPVAHDQVGAVAQTLDQTVQAFEIIAVVGVAHDHEAAARRADPTDQRRAVAALRNGDDTGAQGFGHGLRTVGRAVVGDQHLAGDAAASQVAQGLADADFDRLRLVQAGHQYGQFKRRGLNAADRTGLVALKRLGWHVVSFAITIT